MTTRAPIRVSIGGGKGGVGKSLIAVNLAASIASLGLETVLVDADLGAPNLHTLFGVEKPGPTLAALLDRRIARLEEALVGTNVPHLSLIPGSSVPGAANLGHQEKLKLVRQVRAIDADVVIVDVGAGATFNTIDLFSAAELRLVVATPELTSLHNAYCFLKASLVRELGALARSLGAQDAWIAAFDRGETSRTAGWIDKLAESRPDIAERLRAHVASYCARWIGNRVTNAAEQHAIFALSRLSREYLGIDAPVIANVPPSRAVSQSVARRVPAVLSRDVEPAVVRAITAIAEHVASFQPHAAPKPMTETEAHLGEVKTAETESPRDFASSLGPHLRSEERVPVNLPARVGLASGEHQGTVVDLSPHGVRVISKASVRRGERVRLVIVHAGSVVTLDGEVRHTERGSFGVRLDDDHAVRTGALMPGAASAAVAHGGAP
jgi:flagellar biosynthesis protein FlhG